MGGPAQTPARLFRRKSPLTAGGYNGRMFALMRVSVFRWGLLPGLMFFASASLVLGGEPAKPAPPAKTPPNLGPSGLKKLESDLFKPFQTLSTDSSLDAVLSQPAQPPSPAVSRRARELEDRKKNWVFLDPDEMLKSPREEDLGLSESEKAERDKTRLSPMEEYFNRLSDKQAKKQTKNSKKIDKQDPFSSRDPFDTQTDNEDGKEDVRGSSSDGHSFFGHDSKSGLLTTPVAKPRSFSDIFGTAPSEPSRKEIEEQKARLDAFKELLGSAPKTQPGSLSPVAGLTDLTPKPAAMPTIPSSLPSVPHSSVFDGQFGAVPGLPNVGTLEDQNTKALSVPGITPPLPKTESPKSYFSTTPSFSAPRRQF
jgi:hypothetical protein